MLLAAQAAARNLIFVTNNTKEFKKVSGLKVEDWTKGLCKNMIFSQSTLRTQRKESIAIAKSILSVNSVPSVRDIFFAFTQSH